MRSESDYNIETCEFNKLGPQENCSYSFALFMFPLSLVFRLSPFSFFSSRSHLFSFTSSPSLFSFTSHLSFFTPLTSLSS